MRLPSLVELTPDQAVVLNMPFDGPGVVGGPPGSGKTVMTFYRAWMLNTIGCNVVVMTYSNLLHQYSAYAAADLAGDVRMTTFHRWLRRFWTEQFGSRPPEGAEGEWSYDWDAMLHTLSTTRLRPGAIPHLVIDEGQELPRAFYLMCRMMGANATVFAGDNPYVGERQSTLDEIRILLGSGIEALRLTGNHRSSREISALSAHYGDDGRTDPIAPTRSGKSPILLRMPSLKVFVAELARYAGAHPRLSIGVLCRSMRLQQTIQYELARRGRESMVQVYVSDDRNRSTVDFSRPGIRIVNVASMGGLEFDSVFVPDLEEYAEDPTTLEARIRFHILTSRARDELYLAYRGQHEPSIVANVPATVLERARSG